MSVKIHYHAEKVRGHHLPDAVVSSVIYSSVAEQVAIDSLLSDGYVIADVEQPAALERIREFVVDRTRQHLGHDRPPDPQRYLNSIHESISARELNALRLHIIDGILGAPWFQSEYFSCGRTLLQTLVGNELAMQRRLGLSIQMPGDANAVLPLHSDVWQEDSPFEVVLWVPLVDCYGSKRMFLLPPAANERWRERVSEFQTRGVEALYEALKPDLTWIDITYGQVLVFTHTVMHGNRLNVENESRWSLNLRFKGLFTPYANKRLGDFFIPISLKPASRIGMAYQLPAGFDR